MWVKDMDDNDTRHDAPEFAQRLEYVFAVACLVAGSACMWLCCACRE